MTCSACTGAVEATLGGLTGVSSAAVLLLTNTAEVLFACTLSVCCALPSAVREFCRALARPCSPASGLAALQGALVRAACSASPVMGARAAQVAFDSSVVQPQALLDAVDELGYSAHLRAVRAPGQQLLTARLRVSSRPARPGLGQQRTPTMRGCGSSYLLHAVWCCLATTRAALRWSGCLRVAGIGCSARRAGVLDGSKRCPLSTVGSAGAQTPDLAPSLQIEREGGAGAGKRHDVLGVQRHGGGGAGGGAGRGARGCVATAAGGTGRVRPQAGL